MNKYLKEELSGELYGMNLMEEGIPLSIRAIFLTASKMIQYTGVSHFYCIEEGRVIDSKEICDNIKDKFIKNCDKKEILTYRDYIQELSDFLTSVMVTFEPVKTTDEDMNNIKDSEHYDFRWQDYFESAEEECGNKIITFDSFILFCEEEDNRDRINYQIDKED